MGNPYSDEWQKINKIANNVNVLNIKIRQLEVRRSNLYAQLSNMPYEADEEGNDVNAGKRNALYAQIESVNGLIDEANQREQELSSFAYELASNYRQQAAGFREKATKASGASSQFQKLSGYRFGASTASVGVDLAQQRTQHYEDYVAILSDLAEAAELAAEGTSSAANTQSISERGTFKSPNAIYNGASSINSKTNNADTESDWSGKEGNSVKTAKDGMVSSTLSQLGVSGIPYTNGTPNFDAVSHAKVGTAMAGVGMVAAADAMLAKKFGTTGEEIANYRNENGLEWRDDGTGQNANLIPKSISNEYDDGKVSVSEPTPMEALTAYMCAHNYGKDDYEVYSKDPEWQKLNHAVFDTESKKIKGLIHTKQETETLFLSGRYVTVFDHPFSEKNDIIYNQGSGFPTGPQQTCGCCASGTLMNKTGLRMNERGIVEYAWNNGLCTVEGFTTPKSWIRMLDGMAGIPASNTSGESLENLAQGVEKGKGVIIGISACTFDPVNYGKYNPFKPDGHAVVLDSVVRDSCTGEILEYIIIDSNGKNKKDACKRVPKKLLEKAYSRMQKQSVRTDVIIW